MMFANRLMVRSVGFFAHLSVFIACSVTLAQEGLIDFEAVEIGKPTPTWTDQGITFQLAFQPKKSKAKGRVTFFPHLGTGRKGIVNAMANEPIPVRVTFMEPVKNVKLVLWGSTTSSALVEAFDADGQRIARDEIAHVPVRAKPEDPIPFFELAVLGDAIAYIEVSGQKPGGYVAIDEIRWSK